MATNQDTYEEEQDAVYDKVVFSTLVARMPKDKQDEALDFLSVKFSSEKLALLQTRLEAMSVANFCKLTRSFKNYPRNVSFEYSNTLLPARI